jgi:nitrite reductase (NADH) small subunit
LTPTSESQLVTLCDLEELADGKVVSARIGKARLAIVQTHGEIRVFFGGCPHHGGPRDRGQVRSAITASKPGERILQPNTPVLVCPWHSYEFDLKTGSAVADKDLCLRFIPHYLNDRKVCVQWPPGK